MYTTARRPPEGPLAERPPVPTPYHEEKKAYNKYVTNEAKRLYIH